MKVCHLKMCLPPAGTWVSPSGTWICAAKWRCNQQASNWSTLCLLPLSSCRARASKAQRSVKALATQVELSQAAIELGIDPSQLTLLRWQAEALGAALARSQLSSGCGGLDVAKCGQFWEVFNGRPSQAVHTYRKGYVTDLAQVRTAFTPDAA